MISDKFFVRIKIVKLVQYQKFEIIKKFSCKILKEIIM